MNNNKMPEYHITISFNFKDTDELGLTLGNIVKEIYSRTLDGHFEEKETGLGFEIEINEGADYVNFR